MKKSFVYLVAFALLVPGHLVTAQELDGKYAGRERVEIDHDAMKSMTRDERRAYMQAYKEARAEEARRAGAFPSGDGGYVPLDAPRQVAARALKVPGSNITYDSGAVTGTAGAPSQMIGNRFDFALNTAGTACCFPVESSGSITMITFDMVVTFFGSAIWSLYSDIVGTMAMQVTSMARPGIMTGLNTLTVSPGSTANAYMNGSFLAGIWQFDPTMTALGVDTGTTGGQGFHAISNNDGAVATGLTTVTTGGMGLNAVFRVSGDVATTPVELLHFELE